MIESKTIKEVGMGKEVSGEKSIDNINKSNS